MTRTISWNHLGREAMIAGAPGPLTVAPGPAYVLGRGRRLGTTMIVRVRSSALRLERATTPDAPGTVSFFFVIDGSLSSLDTGTVLRVGDVGCYPGLTHPTTIDEAVDLVFVSVRRDALVELGVPAGSLASFRRLSAELATSARSFLTTLVTEIGRPETELSTESAVTNLLAAVLLQDLRSDARTVAHRETAVRRARVIIAEEAHLPGTTVASIARRVDTPVRTLQRHFTQLGSSPSSELRRARLAIAESLLRADSERPLPIDEVARRSGFTSTRHLRESMKAVYGVTPRHLRGWVDDEDRPRSPTAASS